jgi:hypothetical protein
MYGGFFNASPQSCKTYFNEGLVRFRQLPVAKEMANKYGAQFYSACDGYASAHGIPRPGTNAWRLANPTKSGGRRGTRKNRKTRKGRKSGKSRRNNY